MARAVDRSFDLTASGSGRYSSDVARRAAELHGATSGCRTSVVVLS